MNDLIRPASDAELQQLMEMALQQGTALPSRLDLEPDEASKGLVQLALTLVNLLREVMEKQAMRRMDSGTLSDADIERLGTTFLLLEQRMDQLKSIFGLTDADLHIPLGPLGNLR